MAFQSARLTGDWFDVAGFSKADMERIKERVERMALKKQAEHADKRPWPDIKPVTKEWKASSPLFRGKDKGILAGRTGRLLKAVESPKIIGQVYKDGFTVDVEVGKGLKSESGAFYAAIVHKGWRQTATEAQRDWMRRNLKMWNIETGYSFGTPARPLFGFDKTDVSKTIKRALTLIGIRTFIKRIPFVGRFF